MESNLDFNVIRDKSPAALTPLFVPLNRERETPRKDYCNAVKRSVTEPVSPQVSSSNVVIKCSQVLSSNTNVNRASNVSAKNDSYPLQPSVKCKTNCTGKPNLLIVGDSHIKRTEKDLIVHHLNNTNISLKCKNFDGADVRRIQQIKNHLSIINVNQNIPKTTNFEFSQVDIDSIKKMIDNLDSSKSETFGGIPTNCLKGVLDISAKFLNSVWNNEVLKDLKFASGLKLADTVPVFKKDDSTLVKNHRPVNLLPITSKVFERIMLNQITAYMDEYLSPHLCGYRKGFSTQTALSSLIEKWKQILDDKCYGAAVLMDLSKAFDTINHELLIAKLNAYGFTKESLIIIFSYLSDRWQHVKIDSSFSSWSEIIQGVPQGSVLGPLLFNIYLNDLFLALKDVEVCDFADDTTPFVCDLELNTALNKLEENSAIALNYMFEINYMKLNSDKCHLLVSGHHYEEMFVNIGKDI